MKISIQAFFDGGDRPLLVATVSEDKANHLMKKYQVPQETVDLADSMDPGDGAYVEWLVKNIRDKKIAEEDTTKIKTLLEKFKRLKNSPAFKEKHSTDINRYDPTSLFEALDGFGDSKKQDVRDLKSKGRDGAAIVYQDDDWIVYRVTKKEEAVTLGSGTNWCTAASASTANHYLKDGPLWIFYKQSQPYAQLHIESNQLMNRADKDFRKGKMVRDQALYDVMEKIQDPAMKAYVAKLLPMVHPSERYLSILKTKAPGVIQSALKNMMIDRFPTLEPEIFDLALGEDFISAYLSHFRATDPEVEKAIVNKPAWSSVYALYVLKKRWPEAENLILKNRGKYSSCALYALKFSEAPIESFAQLAKVLPKIKGRNAQVEEFLNEVPIEKMVKEQKGTLYFESALDYMKRSTYVMEPLIAKFITNFKDSEERHMMDKFSDLADFLNKRGIYLPELTKYFMAKKSYENNYYSPGTTEYLISANGPEWAPPKGMNISFEKLDPKYHLKLMLEEMDEDDLTLLPKLDPKVIKENLQKIMGRIGNLGGYRGSFYVKQDFFDEALMPKGKIIDLDRISEDGGIEQEVLLSYCEKYLLPYIYSGKVSLGVSDFDLELYKKLDLDKLPAINLTPLFEMIVEGYDNLGEKFKARALQVILTKKIDFSIISRSVLYGFMRYLMEHKLRWTAYEKWIVSNPLLPRERKTSYGSLYKEFMTYLSEANAEKKKKK